MKEVNLSPSTDYISIDPYTGKKIGKIAGWSEAKINKSLASATAGYTEWSNLSMTGRLEALSGLKQALHTRLEELARLITLEVGKPITQSRAEINKSISLIDYYVHNAEKILDGRKIKVDKDKKARVQYDPQGIILGVMPWNYPVWQVLRFAIPVMAGGNVVMVKQAKNAGQTAKLLDTICSDVFGKIKVFQSIFIQHSQIDRIMQHQRVTGVSVTGSEEAGRAVAATAGTYLKKTVLELGGSDPFIVLKDADIARAAHTAAAARLNNNGQTCIAAKRFIIERAVMPEFTEAFVDAISAFQYGPPADENSQMSVLARADLASSLAAQVKKSVSAGAKLLLRGGVHKDLPACYLPEVLTDIPKNSPAFQEELFGPVAAIFEAADTNEAVTLANASRFGLGASLWTKSKDTARDISRRLECGSVAINAQLSSDPHIPFGGVKASGYGREMSAEGLIEFLNTKSVIYSRSKK